MFIEIIGPLIMRRSHLPFMMEIEIKARCDDMGRVEETLRSLGAVHLADLEQSDLYLSHPCRDFAVTDEALRIRTSGGVVTLHYKGPKVDLVTKTREELTVPVPDPEAMLTILERVGFAPVAEVRKTRRNYQLGPVEASLDQVMGLGAFVELEVQDLPLEEGRSMLFDLMERLGLDHTERRSYLELLLQDR